ncbi:MAG TPA: (d)CMP kinase [Halothiobacillaceae bacterium]|nr:(d)CMP kinase [Halothiobacillaceae bacterium]
MFTVITIDGPSGSGKGTIARRLAAHYGYHLLDSGSLYRLVALKAIELGLAEDAPELVEIARNLDCHFTKSGAILIDGKPASSELRTEQTGAVASKIAAREDVRAALLQRQRDFAVAPGLIADGRDMGTVVFPEASVKIFLDASAEERARRRYKQLIENGFDANLNSLINEIAARDDRDRNRAVAPLVPAEDAEVIDSSNLSVDEVEKIIRRRIDAIQQ